MSTYTREMIDDVLDRLVAAWAASDAKAVADLFAQDGVYSASVGSGPGETATGRAAIHALVDRMFEVDLGAQSKILHRVPTETGAFWSWEYRLPDGSVELGCDLIVIRDGQVALKDAYRKVKT